MTVSLDMITVDTTETTSLAAWWAEQTGGTVLEENDGWYVVVGLPSGLRLSFQKVDAPTPGKNRVHLDLSAADLDAEVARLQEAGAGLVAEREMGDFRWVTLADPAGNEFCVAQASGSE